MPRRLHRGRAARRPGRRRPGRPAGAPREQQVRRGTGHGPGGWASVGSSSTRSTRSTASNSCSPSRRAGGSTDRRRVGRPGPGCWPASPPGSRCTPTSSSAPVRTTPSSASAWPRGRRPRPSPGSPASMPPGSSSSSGSTPIWAARSSPWRRSPGHRRVGRVLRPPRPARAGGGRRTGRGLRQRRGGATHGPVGVLGPRGLPAGRHPRLGPGDRRAGAVDRGRGRASPSTGWARSRTWPDTGPTCRSTAG